MTFRILGTGRAVPEKILSNSDLSHMVETDDQWIRTRVGVSHRHIAAEESTADLATAAAIHALEMSGVAVGTLDLILVATITPDNICPTVAGTVQRRIGATCPAFDISSACSGFLFALDTAIGYFVRGRAKRILVIGAERISKILDWQDRSTCVIFGDGAGAAVLGEGEECLCSQLCTCGGEDVICIPSYGGISPFSSMPSRKPVIYMEGQETFKFAVGAMVSHIQSMCTEVGIPVEDLSYVVPHQANIRIIQMAARKLGLSMEKMVVNIDRYGNTAAASVPIALDELCRSGKLRRGDLIAMTAFGGGLSSAGCIVRWNP